MKLGTYKFFRILSKTSLLVIGVSLVGYLGYLGYISYKFPPYKVTVSNITDSSFTVSWVTDTPTKGYVYYKEKDSFLPGPLGWINSGIAYDDRDWAYNQSVCVNEFNANSEVDDTFTVVNSENFNCEDIEVKDIADFYTHHITLKNLDAEKEYYFRVGNGFWMWNIEGADLTKTFGVLEEVKEPSPMFGRLVVDDYGGDIDSVVYIRFYNQREEKTSVLYSSVTNDEGGWYFDAANTRTESGDTVDILSGEDMVSVAGQFTNLELSELESWVYGYYNGAYPDIEIEYSPSSAVNSRIISRVYATKPREIDGGGPYPRLVISSPPVSLNPPPLEVPSQPSTSTLTEQLSDHAGKVTDDLSEVEKRDTLCEECSDFVDSKTMLDILNNPSKAAGYVGIIGAGNVARILAASGADIGKEALEAMGLKYNAGNMNTIGIVALKSGGDAMKQSTFDQATDSGEIDKVRISSFMEYDSNLGKDVMKWNNPAVHIAGFPTTIKKDDEGNIFVGQFTLDEFLVMTTGSADNAQIRNQINSRLNACGSSDSCDIGLEIVELILSAEAFSDNVNAYIQNCKTNFGNCDVEDLKSSLTSISESFVAYYEEQLTSIQDVKLDENQIVEKVSSILTEYAESQNWPLTATESIVNRIINWEYYASDNKDTELKLYISIEDVDRTDPQSLGVISPDLEKALKEAGVIGDGATTQNTAISAQVANGWIPALLSHYCSDDIQTCLDNVHPYDSIFFPEDLFYDDSEINSEKEAIQAEIEKWEEIENVVEEELSSLGNLKKLPHFSSISNLLNPLKVNAQEEDTDNTFFFIPQIGSYTLELGPLEFEKKVSDGNTIYIFYIEANGEEGIQLPPEGYTGSLLGYDSILKGLASEIKYTKTASAKTYDLKEGINIVSFDFVPSYNKNNIYYAKDLVKQTANRNIEFIAKYDAGRWAEGISCKGTDGCFGTDFPLTPGRGYVIRVSEDTKITIPGYEILDPVPVNYSTGWNLVGVHGYSKAYTAGSLIESINKVNGLTADNVSWWPTSKGRYEGLQVTDGTTYGLDFPISPKNGYFVRISKFNPPSSECRSIIWHEGGNLNGVCGDSKSLF